MQTLHDLPLCFLEGRGKHGATALLHTIGQAREGWRFWLLTGGPLTAKSQLVKALAADLVQGGHSVTLVSDLLQPELAAGLLVEDLRVAVLDGEMGCPAGVVGYPGRYPGLCTRLLDFGSFLHAAVLEKTFSTLQEAGCALEENLHRGTVYLRAAATLLEENLQLSAGALRQERTRQYGRDLARRLIPKGSGAGEQQWYLSGVTGAGPMFYRSTPGKLCSRVIPIADEFGAASSLLLEVLRQEALEAGQRVITCYCPLLPEEKPEQLLLPEAGIAFVVTNLRMQVDTAERTIHARRFLDAAALRSVRQKLLFNRRLAHQLVVGAGEYFALAQAARKEAAGCYDAALDAMALPALLARLEGFLLA